MSFIFFYYGEKIYKYENDLLISENTSTLTPIIEAYIYIIFEGFKKVEYIEIGLYGGFKKVEYFEFSLKTRKYIYYKHQ